MKLPFSVSRILTGFLTTGDRYLLQMLGWGAFLLTLGAVALVWLTQSLHFIPMVVEHGMSLAVFLELTSLLAPALCAVILPVSTCLAILLVYTRLAGDHELTVLRAGGLSNLQLARPGFLCIGGSFTAGLLLSLWIAPAAYHRFLDFELGIRSQLAAFMVGDGVFTRLPNNMVFYARSLDGKDGYQDILIEDRRIPGRPATIFARKAIVENAPTGPRLTLLKGSRQEINGRTHNLELLRFSEEMLDLAPSSDHKIIQDPAELPLSALLNPAGYPPQYRAKFIVEGWHRLLTPFSIVTYGLIALCAVLCMPFSRHRPLLATLTAILIMGTLLLGGLLLKSLAMKNLAFLPLLICPPLLAAAGALALLQPGLKSDNRRKSQILTGDLP